MRVCYSPGYFVPLPAGHRFPMGKFPALHETLLAEGIVSPAAVITPTEAPWTALESTHTVEYLTELATGTLSPAATRRLGLPWSPGLARRSRLAARGTWLAGQMALEDGIAGNLAGGTHHAFADRGEGFCVINDVAVAIRMLRREGRIHRAAVIDLDVHQGNGTASLFAQDPHVFTFSMHGARNYPFHKVPSRLDVPLPDATDDDAYLAALASHLPTVIADARPDIAIYLAGVDVVSGDRFGRLRLTRTGLHERDRYVLQALRAAAIPTVIVLAGGYADSALATADLHAVVFREARRIA